MDLRDADDVQLTLDETEAGVYAMGSYAQALLDEVDEAATHFVQNTAFPYTYTPQRLEDPTFPGDPNLASSRAADATPQGEAAADGTGEREPGSADTTGQIAGVAQVQSTIYDSAQSYFAALNDSALWINYNHRSGAVSVSSLRDFVMHLRPARLEAAPFDRPDRSSRANPALWRGRGVDPATSRPASPRRWRRMPTSTPTATTGASRMRRRGRTTSRRSTRSGPPCRSASP